MPKTQQHDISIIHGVFGSVIASRTADGKRTTIHFGKNAHEATSAVDKAFA